MHAALIERNADANAMALLPRAQQLAALGTLLCLYRPNSGGELAGWSRASRVESCAGLDSDGPSECLVFHDAEGQCCWRLYALPDSDFVAWDRLAAELPVAGNCTQLASLREQLWQRLDRRLRGDVWRSCILRLHALQGTMQPLLAASMTTASAVGLQVARRIARSEGVDGEVFHDCCCHHAVFAGTTPATVADVPVLYLKPETTS